MITRNTRYSPGDSDHGTISNNTANVAERTFNASITDHSYTSAGNHTLIWEGISAQAPSFTIELKVTGGTPTVTLPGTSIISTDSPVTSLATLANGDYVILVKRIVVEGTYTELVSIHQVT